VAHACRGVLSDQRAWCRAADETTLTKEQIKHFLLTARIVGSKPSKEGITHTSRLTLSDGILTHDASFQPIDEHKASVTLAGGRTVHNFVDSYKYNVAAYALAELVDMDDMLPVYVERSWNGRPGSLSWWLPVKMDEEERVKQKIQPPDLEAWAKQMYKIRAGGFGGLISGAHFGSSKTCGTPRTWYAATGRCSRN